MAGRFIRRLRPMFEGEQCPALAGDCADAHREALVVRLSKGGKVGRRRYLREFLVPDLVELTDRPQQELVRRAAEEQLALCRGDAGDERPIQLHVGPAPASFEPKRAGR